VNSPQPTGQSAAPIRTVAIVGGGTAGWMTAAAFAKSFGDQLKVTLVESEEIGTIGVGEATVPHLRDFNRLLQVDEGEFVRKTKGTFKLGIQFRDWRRLGDSYIHGFGSIGRPLGLLDFHQYWLKARARGWAKDDIGLYSLNTCAAPQDRFMVAPQDAPPNSPLADLVYAYHFDAGLYAKFLRAYSEQRGVQRIEGKVVSVQQRTTDGFIEHVQLEGGRQVAADLFIDCSGFRALLINGTLKQGFEDWTHWLPVDRAIAVPCEKVGTPTPYTRSTARASGWQWRIPLQHRTGNGHVYCSKFISDDEATAVLLANLDGKPLADPKPIAFGAGKRRKLWDRNVVAIGLAGGFVEPLESTAIFLIQSGISRLMFLFPRQDFDPVLSDTYNAQAQFEYERIRDFLILHYKATERDDSEMWRYCRNMPIPDTLTDYMRLFEDSGRFFRNGTEMFAATSWVQVMLGQGIMPRGYHPAVDWVHDADLRSLMENTEKVVASCAAMMPPHGDFIARHCAAVD
jgi:tryptophan halogenase